jgi:two-component system, NarL family, response regulator NreC
MSQLSIFLADDHTMVRAGLQALIDAEPNMRVVGEAGDGLEALERIAACQPDVAVVDLVMPRLGGLAVIERLTTRAPRSRVLVLSVHEDMSHLRQALDAGAAGYVLKRSAAETLIGALNVIVSGGIYIDPAFGTVPTHQLIGHHSNNNDSQTTPLSEREAVVLRLIAQGYSNKEIAFQLDLSVKTIETYKARALEKLGLNSRVEIVRYALERGWLNEGE